MHYRKEVHANSELSANSPSDSSFVGVSSEHSNKLHYDVEEHKKLTKAILCGIVDGTLTSAFWHVEFKWERAKQPEFFTVVDPTYK